MRPLAAHTILFLTIICALPASPRAATGSGYPTGDSARVVVTGVRRFDRDRIRALLGERDGLRRVADLYAGAGYWWTIIGDSAGRGEGGERVRVVRVAEGPAAEIAVAPAGNAAFGSRRMATADEVADGIDDWLERQAGAGHPFASAEIVAAREPGDGAVVVEALLRPGPRVTVTGVRPMGNTITRSRVIARELRRPAEWVYEERAIARWRRRLVRTGWFEEVGDPRLAWIDSAAGRAALVVPIVEGQPNRIEGVVGYQPGTAGERGRFTGLADIALGNLWGTGRRLAARWERPRPENTTLDLAYGEPWIAGFPLDAEAAFAVEQRPEYAIERIEAGFSGEVRPDLVVSAGAGREIVRSDSVVLLGGPRSRGWLVSAEAEWDARDDPADPVRGALYRFSWRTTWRRNRVDDADFVAAFGLAAWPAEERTSAARLDFAYWVPIGERVVLSASWHGAQMTAGARDSVYSEAEQLRLGGVGTVRGYREDAYRGDRAAWGNHELAYRLGGGSRAFVFVDAGAVRMARRVPGTGQVERATSWPVGYGLGLRARTAAGVLGIDFGWARGERFGTGKVHVRLETAF